MDISANNTLRSPTRPELEGLLAILILTIIGYAPSLGGEFLWDDDSVSKNPLMVMPGGLHGIWFDHEAIPHEDHYWPVTYTSLWLDAKVWGLWPPGFRITNLLLHLLNVVLFWAVLRTLRIRGAVVVAGVFALHPVHAESVAWIIERKDVLSGLFFFLALLLYIQYRDGGGRWRHVASVTAFGLGLWSKSSILPLPVVLVLVEFWRGRGAWRKVAVDLAPYAVLGVAITLHDLSFVRETDRFRSDDNILGRALRILAFQWGKAAWPIPLATIYRKWNASEFPFVSAAFPILLVVAAGLLGGARRGRRLIVPAVFYGVMLAPTLGFVEFSFMNNAYAADRFQYLALAAPAGVAGGLCAELAKISRRFGMLGGFMVLAACFGGLMRQSPLYRNNEVLFEQTLRVNPGSWLAHHNYAEALSQRGDLDGATKHYQIAAGRKPAAETFNNLGVLAAKDGKVADAEVHYRMALRLKPAYSEARVNLGLVVAKQGRLDEALVEFDRVISENPRLWDAHYNRGVSLVKLGRLQESADAFLKAHELNPANAGVLSNLGHVEIQIGRTREGEAHLRRSLELEDDQPAVRETLGQIEAGRGK